jgi:glycerol-3-phosphate cytidylyltransferase
MSLKKYKIGYTTGVYDMFHVGHLNIIKRSKELCEHLIVGVTTDELVSYKNTSAIVPFHERLTIVESIKYVDQVVSQDTMDKMEAWKNYAFDVMFVGSDWQGSSKWNNLETEFQKVGVNVEYFPYTQGTSSTKLKAALQRILDGSPE